jgi:effector-binding domain-containing protein
VNGYEVVRIDAEPRPTAVLAAETTWPEYPTLWKRILDEVHANVTWHGTGHKGRNVMLYLDDVPHVEVGVELDQPVELHGRIVRSALPAGPVATTRHVGPYSRLGDAHDAVIRWSEAQGLTLAGPRWEVYGQGDVEPPETDIFWLLRD